MEEKIELSNKHSIQFTTVLFIGLGTVFLFWCLQFYWKKRHMYLLSRKTPGPSGWPLIGAALELVGNNAGLMTFFIVTLCKTRIPMMRLIKKCILEYVMYIHCEL